MGVDSLDVDCIIRSEVDVDGATPKSCDDNGAKACPNENFSTFVDHMRQRRQQSRQKRDIAS